MMRKQEADRLRKLARSLDIDYQEFDMQAYDYQTVKAQMLKRAGVTTEEMQKKQLQTWESAAEAYDNLPLEQKIYISDDGEFTFELPNCLVLEFRPHDWGLAVKILTYFFKGNMMHVTERLLDNRKLAARLRMLWFIGHKKTTSGILAELEKHNIRPRILRNSYLRRDFLHYANGNIYPMKTRDFKTIVTKQSIKLADKEEKMQAKMH
jgi:hypothetical protein